MAIFVLYTQLSETLPSPITAAVSTLVSHNDVLYVVCVYDTLKDEHEVCFVGDEAFRILSQPDPHADSLLAAVSNVFSPVSSGVH